MTGTNLLSIKEVALRLGLREQTIRKWVALRTIEHIKVGQWAIRIAAAEVDRIVESGRITRCTPPAPVRRKEPTPGFNVHHWCLQTVKFHPKWKNPAAVSVSGAILNPYREAVESQAKNFDGDLVKAAEDILARTKQYAKDTADDLEHVGVVNYFVYAIYLEHEPEREDPVPNQCPIHGGAQ